MGAVIEAVVTAGHTSSDRPPSSTALAVEAARRTLASAARRPDAIDLLVNASVYRAANIMEPANAAFVQRDVEADGEFAPVKGRRTLSFDISNGACGMVNGLQVVDGFITSGAARHGLVVTGDVDPLPGRSEGYPYAPLGAAILLGPGGDAGFEAFALRSYPQYADLHTSTIRWSGTEHVVGVHEDSAFHARCEECADAALTAFLDERRLTPDDVDLVVASPPGVLKRRSSSPPAHPTLRADQVLDADSLEPARVHTAGIALALESALRSPRYPSAGRVLLVAVGSGITVAIASYRKPRS